VAAAGALPPPSPYITASAAASVSSGSGSHVPTYRSRRTRAERRWLTASLVVTADRYAFWRVDLRALAHGAVEPQEALLHDVLRLAHAAHHAAFV
jgi:hypothetical protein